MKVEKDVVYARAGGRDLRLDLLSPEGASRPPTVVHLHGGGWFEGGRGWSENEGLVRVGFAVADVEYRLSGEAKWPAQGEDARAAVAWVRANGASRGLDVARLGAWGHSAGGHLAAWLGAQGLVQAAVALSPPTDLREPAEWEPWPRGVLTGLFGRPEFARGELETSASPIAFDLRGACPMMLVQGERDDVVPPAQALRMYAALRGAGVPSGLLMVSDAGHDLGEGLLGWGGIAGLAAGFFRRHLL